MVLGGLCLVSGLGWAPGAVGQGLAQPPGVAGLPSPPRHIGYKEESSVGVGALALRLAGLALMATLAFGAAWAAKRYLPGIRGYSLDRKSRIQLLESRRITPKLTLFVLEFEGRRLLLAQSGERVVELGTRSGESGLAGDRARDE